MSRFISTPRVVLLQEEQVGLSPTANLLIWDRRVQFGKIFFCAETLLSYLQEERLPQEKVDIVLVDANYGDNRLSLDDLLVEVSRATDSALIVLTGYADVAVLQAAIAAGARGVLLKGDVRYGLASALVRAQEAAFAYTEGLRSLLWDQHPSVAASALRLHSWQFYPFLENRWLPVAELHFLNGLAAGQVAIQGPVERATVHKYASETRSMILDEAWPRGWYDTAELEALLPDMDANTRVRHLLASLPAAH